MYAGRRGRDGAVEDAVDGAAASEGVQLLFDDRLRRRNNEDMLDESKKLDYIIAGHHSSFNCSRVRCGITKTKFYYSVLFRFMVARCSSCVVCTFVYSSMLCVLPKVKGAPTAHSYPKRRNRKP